MEHEIAELANSRRGQEKEASAEALDVPPRDPRAGQHRQHGRAVLADAVDPGAVQDLDAPVVRRDSQPRHAGVGRVAADRDQVRLLLHRQPLEQVSHAPRDGQRVVAERKRAAVVPRQTRVAVGLAMEVWVSPDSWACVRAQLRAG